MVSRRPRLLLLAACCAGCGATRTGEDAPGTAHQWEDWEESPSWAASVLLVVDGSARARELQRQHGAELVRRALGALGAPSCVDEAGNPLGSPDPVLGECSAGARRLPGQRLLDLRVGVLAAHAAAQGGPVVLMDHDATGAPLGPALVPGVFTWSTRAHGAPEGPAAFEALVAEVTAAMQAVDATRGADPPLPHQPLETLRRFLADGDLDHRGVAQRHALERDHLGTPSTPTVVVLALTDDASPGDPPALVDAVTRALSPRHPEWIVLDAGGPEGCAGAWATLPAMPRLAAFGRAARATRVPVCEPPIWGRPPLLAARCDTPSWVVDPATACAVTVAVHPALHESCDELGMAEAAPTLVALAEQRSREQQRPDHGERWCSLPRLDDVLTGGCREDHGDHVLLHPTTGAFLHGWCLQANASETCEFDAVALHLRGPGGPTQLRQHVVCRAGAPD